MLKVLKIACLLFMCAMVGFVMKTVSRSHQKEIYMSDSSDMPVHPPNGININLTNILSGGNGILFLETTDRMEPPSLVLCAIESAARVYHDRPILYFMKGLHDIETDEDMNRTRNLFPALSSFDNVHILPLRFEELFNNTPLQSWYEKVNPAKEIYWTHVKSDACRFAMMWKYGGIYMDTDVISIKPIPEDHFLAAQSFIETSSSVFGLSPHHKLTWEFMENFVQNYRGGIWGHQGPGVFSRVVAKYCGVPQFKSVDHVDCANVSYFHPERFYPIPYQSWRDYFKVDSQKDVYWIHILSDACRLAIAWTFGGIYRIWTLMSSPPSLYHQKTFLHLSPQIFLAMVCLGFLAYILWYVSSWTALFRTIEVSNGATKDQHL